MKKHLVFGLILGLGIVACKKKGCTDALAENYNVEAKKEDGSCTYQRDKFIGTYQISSKCAYDDDTTYSITITEGPTVNDIIIQNFANESVNMKAKIVNNQIEFDDELIGIIFEGDGYLVGSELTINYTACEAFYFPCTDPESCVKTGIKQ